MAPITWPVALRIQDTAVAYDDFVQDHSIWEDKVWPTIAHRIPQFEAIKLRNSWAGHYAYNTFDQNAILGPHTKVEKLYFRQRVLGSRLSAIACNGRGTAELITHGEYRALDLTPFNYDRIERDEKFVEKAVI